jgi:cytochrome c peroxidase
MSPKSRNFAFIFPLVITGLLFVAVVHGQGPNSIPNGAHSPNPGGTASTYSTAGSVDLTGPFFQSLGTNGRSCGSCHQPSDGMSVSADDVQQRFDISAGLDPIFRTNDGSNCDNLDVSTLQARSDAYSLLRTRGLIRIAIDVPAGADFQVTNVQNRYGCNNTNTISMYRRPLPATNLRFLSTVMWDGRESSAATGTTKISFDNYPDSLLSNLAHQAVDATNGHAQGNGLTADQQQQIVNFEMGLFSAQDTTSGGGTLSAQGANGDPIPLINQPFFISINSSVNPLVPALEQPGGLVTPGDGHFTPAIFNIFDAWANLPPSAPRAAIARGQALFTSKPITITGVAGINDDASAGGLVSGGIPSLTGTCGTCHDTPNVGNHSFPTPLNIGVGDLGANSTVSMGGLDISYLPKITVCRVSNPSDCKTTTDLGQALIDGKFDHVGKLKGPILRSLSSRAPYFHNGSARTLLDAVRFYEVRFGVSFTAQEESDLVAFLSAL